MQTPSAMSDGEKAKFGILRPWRTSRADFFRNVPRLIDGKASGVGLASCSCILFF